MEGPLTIWWLRTMRLRTGAQLSTLSTVVNLKCSLMTSLCMQFPYINADVLIQTPQEPAGDISIILWCGEANKMPSFWSNMCGSLTPSPETGIVTNCPRCPSFLFFGRWLRSHSVSEIIWCIQAKNIIYLMDWKASSSSWLAIGTRFCYQHYLTPSSFWSRNTKPRDDHLDSLMNSY